MADVPCWSSGSGAKAVFMSLLHPKSAILWDSAWGFSGQKYTSHTYVGLLQSPGSSAQQRWLGSAPKGPTAEQPPHKCLELFSPRSLLQWRPPGKLYVRHRGDQGVPWELGAPGATGGVRAEPIPPPQLGSRAAPGPGISTSLPALGFLWDADVWTALSGYGEGGTLWLVSHIHQPYLEDIISAGEPPPVSRVPLGHPHFQPSCGLSAGIYLQKKSLKTCVGFSSKLAPFLGPVL